MLRRGQVSTESTVIHRGTRPIIKLRPKPPKPYCRFRNSWHTWDSPRHENLLARTVKTCSDFSSSTTQRSCPTFQRVQVLAPLNTLDPIWRDVGISTNSYDRDVSFGLEGFFDTSEVVLSRGVLSTYPPYPGLYVDGISSLLSFCIWIFAIFILPLYT